MAVSESPTSLKDALQAIAQPEQIDKVARFYRGPNAGNRVLGIPIGRIFPVAKRFVGLSLADIETLLDDPHYEVRMAAVAVMDFKARAKGIVENVRRELYDLYLRRHDRIDNWDLVDRAAPWVVGEYLVPRDRAVLYRLAASGSALERRTAIVATYAFIRRSETEDTFAIADLLAGDQDEYVQKAVASWVREAGKQNPSALLTFLHRNRDRLPRVTLRDASKRLAQADRTALLKK
jgi:3-methyladenine DNA glycosylase AlkD